MNYFDEKWAYYAGKRSKVRMPKQGLVFYAPLNGSHSTAETGQTLVLHGIEDYRVVQGISCLCHTHNTNFWLQAKGTYPKLTNTGGYTLSAWLRYSASNLKAGTWFGGLTKETSWGNCMLLYGNNSGRFNLVHGGGGEDVGFSTFSDVRWRHLAAVLDGPSSTVKGYVNGSLVVTNSSAFSTYVKEYTAVRLCTDYAGDSRGKLGTYNMAAFRIYSRALDDQEIAALASEFTPTA